MKRERPSRTNRHQSCRRENLCFQLRWQGAFDKQGLLHPCLYQPVTVRALTGEKVTLIVAVVLTTIGDACRYMTGVSKHRELR